MQFLVVILNILKLKETSWLTAVWSSFCCARHMRQAQNFKRVTNKLSWVNGFTNSGTFISY